jgi:hypothetical protein
MTPERITVLVMSQYGDASEWAEIKRLALLGKRVEEAPVADPFPTMGLVDQHMLTGKRVRLVVEP